MPINDWRRFAVSIKDFLSKLKEKTHEKDIFIIRIGIVSVHAHFGHAA